MNADTERTADVQTADFLAHIVHHVEAGRPMPAELAEPLVDALQKAEKHLRSNHPRRRRNAQSAVSDTLGITGAPAVRTSALDEIEVVDLFDDTIPNRDLSAKYGVTVRSVQAARGEVKAAMAAGPALRDDILTQRKICAMAGADGAHILHSDFVRAFPDGFPAKPTAKAARRVRAVALGRIARERLFPDTMPTGITADEVLNAVFSAHHKSLTPAWIKTFRDFLPVDSQK